MDKCCPVGQTRIISDSARELHAKETTEKIKNSIQNDIKAAHLAQFTIISTTSKNINQQKLEYVKRREVITHKKAHSELQSCKTQVITRSQTKNTHINKSKQGQ